MILQHYGDRRCYLLSTMPQSHARRGLLHESLLITKFVFTANYELSKTRHSLYHTYSNTNIKVFMGYQKSYKSLFIDNKRDTSQTKLKVFLANTNFLPKRVRKSFQIYHTSLLKLNITSHPKRANKNW